MALRSNIFRWSLSTSIAIAALTAACATPTLAQPVAGNSASVWVTLGTNSGPIPNPHRSEAANLLHRGDQNILVDVGEGAVSQLTKAGYSISRVQTVLISHLHFDHTSGLFALLSLRFQTGSTDVLTIYGPPGTQATVDGLTSAMVPAITALGPMHPANGHLPKDTVRVVEIADGSTFTIGDIKVTAAVNGHYDFPPGSPAAANTLSFAYRFDMPDRSIAYTGDTGPNANLEKLARNVDVLISEITFEPGLAIARLKVQKPDLAESAIAALEHHFAKEHLSPEEAGLMAQRTGAKSLIFTHNPLPPADIEPARSKVAVAYKGSVTFANDLDTF